LNGVERYYSKDIGRAPAGSKRCSRSRVSLNTRSDLIHSSCFTWPAIWWLNLCCLWRSGHDFSLTSDDLIHLGLPGRVVDIVPDADWQSNATVNRAVHCLADALRARGARPRVVMVPSDCKGIDDYLVSRGHGA
jgi:hypothetical protein